MKKLLVMILSLAACGPERPDTALVYIHFSEGEVSKGKYDVCYGKQAPTYTGTPQEKLAIIDRIIKAFEPFDVKFTTLKPEGKHYLLFITNQSGGNWCGQNVGGITKMACEPIGEGTAHVFDSAEFAPWTAVHELGHLVGSLDHIAGPVDPAMSIPNVDFPDAFFYIEKGNPCNFVVQNPYQSLMSAWGPSK